MFALIFIILSALVLPGFIVRFRALLAGRRGKPFFQHLSDVSTDLGKYSVYSETSTFITRIAAPIDLGSSIVAMLCIPVGIHESIFSFQGDIIFMFAMLSLGKVMMILAAMDSSSSFGGMGASREAFYSILCEPAFMILMAVLCMATHTWSFSQLYATFGADTINLQVLSLLVGYGIFKLSLVEMSRIPVDDPRTHLELTMVHESCLLDFSAPDMAFVKVSAWIKGSIWCALCVNTIVPAEIPLLLEIVILIASVILFALMVSVVESFRARSPLKRVPLYILSISAIGLLAMSIGYAIMSVQII